MAKSVFLRAFPFILFHIIALVLAPSALHALPSGIPLPPRPDVQSVQLRVGRSIDRGIEGATTFVSSGYGAVWRRAEAFGGWQASRDTMDVATAFEFFPDLFRFDLDRPWDIRLGFGVHQHFQWQFGLAFEADLYLNTDFQIVGEGGFLFAGQAGIGLKLTDLYAISGGRGILVDNSLAMTIRIEKTWRSGWDVYFRAGTHDFYRLPLFPHPNYVLGLGKRVASGSLSGLRLGGEAQVRMNDQFTTPPRVDGVEFRMVVNYAF